MRCEHAFDDGAYVLGALSPAERDRYEKHLAGCSDCREAVASLAVLPGLLGRLSPSQVPMALDSQGSEQRLPRLIHTVQASRKRRRRQVVGAFLVTACVAVFAGLGFGSARIPSTPPPDATGSSSPAAPSPSVPPMNAMRPLEGVPVTAAIGLTEVPEGTAVRMKCWYPPDDEHTRRYSFFLIAFGHDGEREQVGSWTAAAGEDVLVTGMVRLPVSDLQRFEVQKKDGTTLLVYEVP